MIVIQTSRLNTAKCHGPTLDSRLSSHGAVASFGKPNQSLNVKYIYNPLLKFMYLFDYSPFLIGFKFQLII